MTKKKRHRLFTFLSLLVAAICVSGCSQEPYARGGLPADIRLFYLIITSVLFFGFILILLRMNAKNRQLRKKYEKQASTLSAIYSALPDFLFIKDKNRAIISCNQTFADFHERTESDIIGKTSADLYQNNELVQNIINADDTVFNEKKLVKEHVWRTFSDGTKKFFETIRAPMIQDGEVTSLLGIGRDMTEFKKLLEQYKDMAATLSSIYNTLPDTVFTKDKNGFYTDCNHVLEKLFGLEKSEIIGRTSEDIFRKKDLVDSFVNSDRVALKEGKPVKDQLWINFPAGPTRFFETIKVPLIRDGEISGLLGIGRDITEFKNLLDELDKSHKITKLMLDTIPFCCIMINRENVCFACNSETTRLFKLKDKQEFIDHYLNLSPKYQPNGWLSERLSEVYLEKAFEEGQCSFDWTHQLLDGTLIPAQVTFVRANYDNDYAVIAYVRDMREHIQMVNEIEKQNTLLKTLNKVSSMLLDPDAEEFESNLFDSMILIAEVINVERVSIWKNYTKGKQLHCTLTYEWLSDMLPNGGNDAVRDISYNDNLPGCQKALSKGQCLSLMSRNVAQPEQAGQQQTGTLSAFAVPVFVRGAFWGFVAFDDCRSKHKFVKNEELILRSFSRMIACTLIRNEMALDIRTTTKQLEIMVKEAHEASKAKSDFLAKMSHEIRTPMNAIAGMTELALREKEMDNARRHIYTIKQASANLLSIINDILDITKIESGKMEIISDCYQFSSLMNDVINIIKMRLIDSQLRFTVNIDSSIPNELYGDETRIRQILINLLGNAIKYTEEGYVSFTATGTKLDENSINLSIGVKDTGRGIRQEDLDKLFDDFSQFDTAKNRSIEGTGLGLAITWNILNAMGGDIKVESEYGVGSNFAVTLPQKFYSPLKLAIVKKAEEKRVLVYERRDIYANSIMETLEDLGVNSELAANETAFREKLESGAYSFIFLAPVLYAHSKRTILEFAETSTIVLLTEFGEAPSNDGCSTLAMPAHCISVANILNGVSEVYSFRENESLSKFSAPDARVLVVDDIKTNLTVTEGLLLPYKVHVDLCKSGAEAVEAVQARRYDLVFMDHWMVEMDGVEAAKRIRAMSDEDSYFKNIPIIALTANAISGTRDMFIKNGFNDFLTKPIDTVKLNSILERWIPKRKQKKLTLHKDEAAEFVDSRAASLSEIAEKIKGLNINKGITLTGGSYKRYLETLSVFYDDGLEKTIKLKTCLAAGNIPLYAIHVHALKSAAANIGAEELSNAAGELEMAGKQADLAFLEENNPKFLASLESLLRDIHHLMSAHRESGEKAASVLDAKALKTRLTSLKQALETLNAHAMNSTMDALLGMELPDNDSTTIQSISRNILMAEYDEALTLTESLLQDP